jgi:hypothetical protein
MEEKKCLHNFHLQISWKEIISETYIEKENNNGPFRSIVFKLPVD